MLDKIFKSFIAIVVFYGQKMLKMGIHGNEIFIFAWDGEELSRSKGKHTTHVA